MPIVSQNHHGKAGSQRVLVSLNLLDQIGNDLQGALSALEFFDIDKDLQKRLERTSDYVHRLARSKPYRPRAPKGYALVPQDVLTQAIYSLNDGAEEFEDAAGYCNAEDKKSCTSHAAGIRHSAAQLRRYVRKLKP